MRAVLTNFGTTGDIQPFLALALELRNHGHQTTVALSPNFEKLVHQLGFKFVPIGPNLDRKSTRLNSSHLVISYAVFCLKKKKTHNPCISAHQAPYYHTYPPHEFCLLHALPLCSSNTHSLRHARASDHF